MAAKSNLKRGEKVLFGIAGIFIVVALVGYAALEGYRLTAKKQIFSNLTSFDLSENGNLGHRIFKDNQCTACHRAFLSGTSMGGQTTLDGIGSRRSHEWLVSFLSDPEPTYRDTYHAETIDHGLGKEAAYVAELGQDELFAVATFLSELRSQQGASTSPIPPKGESPFIESMLSIWAPESWKDKYQDIRTKDFSDDITAPEGGVGQGPDSEQ